MSRSRRGSIRDSRDELAAAHGNFGADHDLERSRRGRDQFARGLFIGHFGDQIAHLHEITLGKEPGRYGAFAIVVPELFRYRHINHDAAPTSSSSQLAALFRYSAESTAL